MSFLLVQTQSENANRFGCRPLPSSGLGTQVAAWHPGQRNRWVLLGKGDAGPENLGELSLKDLFAVTRKRGVF